MKVKLLSILPLFFLSSNAVCNTNQELVEVKQSIKELIQSINEYQDLNNKIIKEIKNNGSLSDSSAKQAIAKLTELTDKNYATYENNYNPIAKKISNFNNERKIAIIVGIDSYDKKNGFYPLSYSVSDAYKLSKTLQKQGYLTKLLTNKHATKSTILNTIEEVNKKFGNNKGSIVFYYSGHSAFSDNDNYLVLYGADINKIDKTGVSLRELTRKIEKIDARNKYLFSDINKYNSHSSEGIPIKTITSHPLFKGVNNIQILSSTRPGEIGFEAQELKHGVFSYFLIKALSGEATNKEGIIDFRELSQYVENNVRKWTLKNEKIVQNPIIITNSSDLSSSILAIDPKSAASTVTTQPQ